MPTSPSGGKRPRESSSNMGVNEINRLIAELFRKLGWIVMSFADHMNHTTDACFPNSFQMKQTLTSNRKRENTLKWWLPFKQHLLIQSWIWSSWQFFWFNRTELFQLYGITQLIRWSNAANVWGKKALSMTKKRNICGEMRVEEEDNKMRICI